MLRTIGAVGFAFGIVAILLGVAVWLGGAALYALLCTWLSRLALRVLSVPQEFTAECRRDRWVTIAIFVSLCGCVGVILPFIVYAIGIHRHFKERSSPTRVARSVLPRIPHIALSELIVMAFSIGAYPMFAPQTMGAEVGEEARWFAVMQLASALLVFPLCFASAYLRLDGNRVPLRLVRFQFLFLYPYFLHSWVLLGSSLFYTPMSGVWHGYKGVRAVLLRMVVVPALVIILTWLVARRAKRLAVGTWAPLDESARQSAEATGC